MRNTLCLTLMAFMVLCYPLTTMAQSDVKPIQISIWESVQIFDSETSIYGVRINLLYGVNQDVYGLDLGLVNKLNGDMKGAQGGLVNLVEGDVGGTQSGLVNLVKGDREGLQIGVVNMAGTLKGLQIGIVNINNSGEPHRFLPIVNFSF